MKLESQVCSLELAKRLKELGVKQESLFYFFNIKNNITYLFCKMYEQYSKYVDLDINNGYSAFTVAELGEILPSYIEIDGFTWWICLAPDYELYYENGKKDKEIWPDYEEEDMEVTEANIRAKMLIYLIENGLIKVEP